MVFETANLPANRTSTHRMVTTHLIRSSVLVQHRAPAPSQMLPSDPTLLQRTGLTSPSLASCVHVTPLRASRALALRFLSHKFGVDLDAFTLMVVPLAATAVDGGDAVQVRETLCNNLTVSPPNPPYSWVSHLNLAT